ncbi:Cytochrome P450 [Ophiocordyceps sinensis CO18]|nr:Cytochrome P450 [Ophiocordyceps sinensis CO18]
MYNTYALHRDERVFGSRPEAFEPERWRGLRPGWGYLPFSGGPRICMGQQLALTEVQYVAARMAQTFQAIEGRGEREWVELDALATTCRGGVKVSLTRASS